METSVAHLKLWEAKKRLNISFEQLGQKVSKDEVWIAALFFNMVQPSARDVEIISEALQLSRESLLQDFQAAGPPSRRYSNSAGTDPLTYRLHELIYMYGPAIKCVVDEKFGDGVLSSVDVKIKVNKAETPAGDRVQLIFDGKFHRFESW